VHGRRSRAAGRLISVKRKAEMGGKSFKCPLCEKWFLEKKCLKDHALGKHGLENVTIDGVGCSVKFAPRPMKKGEHLTPARVTHETLR
jgi:hypothetical protein